MLNSEKKCNKLPDNFEISFFNCVYKRHTNFAFEYLEYEFNGNINFSNEINLKIPRSGDLISKMILKIELDSFDPKCYNFAWVKKLGHAIINEANITLGGKNIDTHNGVWLDIWYELVNRKSHEEGYNKLIGNVKELIEYNTDIKPKYTLLIPLQFWFNKIYTLSFPLLKLFDDYSMDIKIKLEDLEKLIIVDKSFNINSFKNNYKIKNASLIINYIYLSEEETKKFMNTKILEYLIDQVQIIGPNICKEINNINFNKLVKEIFWVTRKYNKGEEYLYYNSNLYYKNNKKDYNKAIIEASQKLVLESISITYVNDEWVKIKPYSKDVINNYYIYNKRDKCIYFNPNSLIYNNINYLNKISAEIIVDNTDIEITILDTMLNICDLSIPVKLITDTRNKKNDPIIYDHFNYGIYIDGSINPIDKTSLYLSTVIRFDELDGEYFNYIEPEKRHSCIPSNGINVYSFSLYPENLNQPSGALNMRFDNTYLKIKYKKEVNKESRDILLFANNYNILRIGDGIANIYSEN